MKLYVNKERTILVTIYPETAPPFFPVVTVAFREAPDHTWGPPVELKETS